MPVPKEETLTPSPYFSERYVANLAGASSMWAEMQALLDHKIANLSTDAVRSLIVEENVLNKRTDVNRKKTLKKLTERYSLKRDNPVFAHFLTAYYTEVNSSQRALLGYLLLCANDLLVRRLSADWLAPRLARDGTALATDDLVKHVSDVGQKVPALARWTPVTRLHVCQHYLGSVRDFGLAEGRVVKRSQRPYAGSRVLVYALQLGRLQGLKPLDLLASDWMRVLGLDLDTAITRMYQLNAEGLAKFRMAGHVAELTLLERIARDTV
jgi:hypothetical protein